MATGVLLSAFALALLGGVHCAAMCGGIALALEPAQPAQVTLYARRADWVRATLALHAGRLTSYTLLGALLGLAGAAAWKAGYLPIQRALFAAGSAALLLAGLRMLGARHPSGLKRLAAPAAMAWARLATRVLARARTRAACPLARRYAAGLAWGLVPCGMVYGALGLALVAGNAAAGALVMLVFGLGTLPNLLMLSGLAAWLRRLGRRPWLRRAAGLAVAGFGVAGLARAAMLPQTLTLDGFCLAF